MADVARRSTPAGTRTTRMLGDQLRHAVVDLWRAKVVLVLTLLLPLVWLLVIGLLAGDTAVDPVSGVRVMQLATPSALTMGVLFAAFPTVAMSLAEARAGGVLKRWRGTPLPVWVHLAGRVGAAAVFGLASVVVSLTVSAVAYDVRVEARALPTLAATLLLGLVCFAALGVAVGALVPSATAAQAVAIGTAVAACLVSGVLTIGARLPAWLGALAACLPVKPFWDNLRAPFAHEVTEPAAWAADAAVLVAWGVVAVLVAVRQFAAEPGARRRPAPHDRALAGAGPGRAVRRDATAPDRGDAAGATHRLPVVDHRRLSDVALVLEQARAADRATRRDGASVFFAVVMPLGLYALLMTTQEQTSLVRGLPLHTSYAAGMVAWGAAVTAFVNVPEAVAQARDRGVLKRLRSMPPPLWHHLLGRAVAALWLAVVICVAVLLERLVLAGAAPSVPALVLGLLVLGLGTLALAACGLVVAAAAPSAVSAGAITLVVLLPLGFFSDVFVVGGPQWMRSVGSVFPLQRLQASLAAVWDPGGITVPWESLAVLAGWFVVAGSAAALLAQRRSARST